MVFSARTDAPAAQQKFVTIIAQPDLYGNPLVLLKNVTDNAHLDETPRMHLVDAVDALADNRGELLFELRGATPAAVRALSRAARDRGEDLRHRRGRIRGSAGKLMDRAEMPAGVAASCMNESPVCIVRKRQLWPNGYFIGNSKSRMETAVRRCSGGVFAKTGITTFWPQLPGSS